jgi:sigma54-dependent transcription regulator
MDLFDRLQLEAVVRLCRESKTLSDAGRKPSIVHVSSAASSTMQTACASTCRSTA